MQIGIIVDEKVPTELVKRAKRTISGYYRSEVIKIENMGFPSEYRKDTINVKKLIYNYEDKLPGNYNKYIFLTTKGIALNDNAKYSTRGFSKHSGILCAVSTLVISNEATSRTQFEYLFAKVIIHELGHLLGLEHCNENCVMLSSFQNGDNFYHVKNALCNSCLKKIDSKNIRKKYRAQ